jgi:hypothetical protein
MLRQPGHQVNGRKIMNYGFARFEDKKNNRFARFEGMKNNRFARFEDIKNNG